MPDVLQIPAKQEPEPTDPKSAGVSKSTVTTSSEEAGSWFELTEAGLISDN
jgi:hypothetical protein